MRRWLRPVDLAGGMPVEGGDLDLGASVTVTWELR